MNNSEIINLNEGKKVDSFIWPFYRYRALIPKKLGGDLFVWLFLSLLIYTNQDKGFDNPQNYVAAKEDVVKLLNEKFSTLIDQQTLDKIIHKVEKDFIEKGKIKQEAFGFIDSYENLFSNQLEVQYIYQDAITGEVLPFFGDTSFLRDSENGNENNRLSVKNGIKEPSKRAVKKAYEQYIKLVKYNSEGEIKDAELDDDFIDKDEPTFFDDGSDEITFVEEKKSKNNLKDYSVIFLKNTKVKYDLDVPILIENNALVVTSPFDKVTNKWLNKCLEKGINVSQDFDNKIKLLRDKYLIEEDKIKAYIEQHKNDFASTLKYCTNLYRMIETLNDDDIKKSVINLDYSFIDGNNTFYIYCGTILDNLVRVIKYNDKTTGIQRKQTDFTTFCVEIDNKCRDKFLEYNMLKSKYIYEDWLKKYTRSDNKEYMSFKADITDIILRTNLVNSGQMYNSFLVDLFYLYSLRNAAAHGEKMSNTIDRSVIDKLTKVVKVIFELI